MNRYTTTKTTGEVITVSNTGQISIVWIRQ